MKTDNASSNPGIAWAIDKITAHFDEQIAKWPIPPETAMQAIEHQHRLREEQTSQMSGSTEGRAEIGSQHEPAKNQEIDGAFVLSATGKGQTAEMPENAVGASLPAVGLNQTSKQVVSENQASPAQSISDDEPEEEAEPCGDYGRSPRDPSHDPEHDWEFIGETDGHSFYRCRKCSAEYDI